MGTSQDGVACRRCQGGKRIYPSGFLRELVWVATAVGLCEVFAGVGVAEGANTATVTESLSLTQTLSGSLTATIPTESDTLSATFTIPTGTASFSLTTTLPTVTATATTTLSVSGTFTIPTGTATHSLSLTLPTATETDTRTFTLSLTLSDSITPSDTFSLTKSLSLTKSDTFSETLTLTRSINQWNNYTTGMSPLGRLFEGQEVRISLSTSLEREGDVALFNATEGFSELTVRVYLYSSTLGADCSTYTGSSESTVYYETSQYGVSTEAQQNFVRFITTAFVTFTAPLNAHEFLICFKHTPFENTGDYRTFRFAFSGIWVLFTKTGMLYDAPPSGLHRGDYIFSTEVSPVMYYLHSAVPGEHVVMELNSVATGWNFTRPSSNCTLEAKERCREGDSLKIVPKGKPCSYEPYLFHHDPYYGGDFTEPDGSWDSHGVNGVFLGATAGGVAQFGHQDANPLVESDALLDPSMYPAEEISEAAAVTLSRRTAYAYLRLPREGGSYDICFSPQALRAEWRLQNQTLSNAPMWMKVYPCSSARCVAKATQAVLSFTLAPTTLGWTLLDMRGGTYGTVRVDSGVRQVGLLNLKPVRSKDDSSALRNYFNVLGGDQLRIVPIEKFSDSFTQRQEPNEERPYGSTPSPGCWWGGNDRWWDEGTDMPSGVRDFIGDPTLPRSSLLDEAETAHAAYGGVYVPDSGSWMVCYRRGGMFGWLPLPFHNSTHGVPKKWQALEAEYTPALTFTQMPDYAPLYMHHGTLAYVATPLIPGFYGTPEQRGAYPPDVVYYVNDSRRGTWGPITVTNYTEGVVSDGGGGGRLSAMPWNFRRVYQDEEAVLGGTVGSALRLVHPASSCDALEFEGSENADGGEFECNNAHSQVDCSGSSLDSSTLSEVTYYLTFPECISSSEPSGSSSASGCTSPNYCNLCNSQRTSCFCMYKVCWRQGGYNWQVISPQEISPFVSDGSWDDTEVAVKIPGVDVNQRAWRLSSKPPGWFGGYYGSNVATKYLRIDVQPSVSLLALESRAGMEAGFLFSDTPTNSLSVAKRGLCASGTRCDSTGDIFRLVESQDSCDITPSKWAAGQSALADTRLSLHCPVTGQGDVSLSGLTTAPCSLDAGVMATLCGGVPCTTASPLLQYLFTPRGAPDPVFKAMWHIYDDIVPGDSESWGAQHTFASVILPDYDPAKTYKQCYKQATSPNWIVFNSTWRLDPSPGLSVAPASSEITLLCGELQQFLLYSDAITFEKGQLNHFEAKLVPSHGQDTDGCSNHPGGTEAMPFGGTTNMFVANTTLLQFHITVPQEQGAYWLCMRLESDSQDGLSWSRHGPYTANDNQIRWYLTPGNLPVNQGTSLVSIARCKWVESSQYCDTTSSSETFTTDPGMDQAKIVPWTHDCHDGEESKLSHGSSGHVGREGGGVNGVTDLGPADGLAATADFIATLPETSGDVAATYKVCVRTFFGTVQRTAWAEVREAIAVASQVFREDSTGAKLHFTTSPSNVHQWAMSDMLQPSSSLQLSGIVALGGASTLAVGGLTTGLPYVFPALNLTLYSGASVSSTAAHAFKLVQVRSFATRTPPPPYTGANWVTKLDPTATCISEGVPGSIIGEGSRCTDPDLYNAVTCPGISLTDGKLVVDAQLPVQPGFYIVCYKSVSGSSAAGSAATPWLNLLDASGNAGFWVVPPFMEFDAGQISAVSPQYDTLQASDIRTHGGASLSSWCSAAGTGINCTKENPSSHFNNDWIAVINDTMNCPVVATPNTTVWSGGKFYPLVLQSNETVKVTGELRIPPLTQSPSRRYKICLLKSGDWGQAFAGVTDRVDVVKRGVVYQLWNRASPTYDTLGQTGFFQPAQSSTIDEIRIVSSLDYNSSIQFLIADAATEGLYRNVDRAFLPESSSQNPSVTPVLRSGNFVDIQVSALSAGNLATFTSLSFEIKFCKPAVVWADLLCTETIPAGSTAPFDIVNTKSTCSDGPRYGWPDGGLKQFLRGGSADVRIQYRSQCPMGSSEINAGCGIIVVATTSAGQVLSSKPLWVNVGRNQPDAVAIDFDSQGAPQRLDTGVLPGVPKSITCSGPPGCFIKTCRTHRTCTAMVMALLGGPREFSTSGSFQMTYSAHDYGGVDGALLDLQEMFSSGVKQFLDNQWNRDGTFNITFTPKLKSGVNEGHIIYNVSYGAALGQKSWTRIILRIIRPQPTRLLMQEIVALDADVGGISRTLERQPVPVWRATENPSLAFETNPSDLTAQGGSYLESLVPYELRFRAEGLFEGTRVLLEGGGGKQDLSGWELHSTVKNVVGNKLLQVVYDPACPAPACIPGAGSKVHPSWNLHTSKAYSAELPPVEPIALEKLRPSITDRGDVWVVRFRLQNGLGCGRIAGTAPGGEGCLLQFTLKPALPTNPTPPVSAVVSTPVRTVANTIRVSVDRSASPLHEGILVTLVPGVIDGRVDGSEFLVDEFHFGEIYALIGSPLPIVDGIFNKDGVRADFGTGGLPVQYTPSVIIGPTGRTWGVQYNLKPTKPCVQCLFTFHSTWGAGPTSAVTVEGAKSLSFTDTANGVFCTPDVIPQIVGYTTGSTTTSLFTVNVTAGVLDSSLSTPVLWPRWTVFINAGSGLTIPATDGGFPTPAASRVRLWKNGRSASLFSKKMGSGGVAVFDALQLELIDTAAGAAFPSQIDFEFTTVRVKYSNTLPGTVKEATVQYSCKSRATIERINTDSAKFIELNDMAVTGATALCPNGPAGCKHWQATIDAELSFPINVFRYDNGQKLPYENHGGTPSVRISSRAASWTCTTTSCQTNTLNLRSTQVYSDVIYVGGATFTYGTSSVEITKLAKQPSSGDMSVNFRKFTGPVRGVPVDLCLTKTTDGNEVIDASVECVTIYFYLKPAKVEKYRIGVASNDLLSNELKAGSEICGPGTMGTIGLIAYYVYSGKNYIAYDMSVTYTIRTKAGLIFAQPNSAISVEQLTQGTALPAGATLLEKHSHHLDPVAWVEFYGLNPVSTPFNFMFDGEDNDRVVTLSSVQSDLEYTYKWGVQLHTAFDLMPSPVYDDECVQKAHLPTTVNHYRAFTPNPGKGWSYAQQGAVVGVPFPIQARVSHGGERSFAFSPALVIVRKLGATACNDGGDLTTYVVTPSKLSDGVRLLDGTLENSFTPLAVGQTTQYGQSTVWPTFTKPCQACTLEVTLCYAQASFSSDPAACLQGGTAAEREPIFGERMKITKTFTVRYPTETSLHIVEQSEALPAKVGELFSIKYDVVQEHAGWTSVVPQAYRGSARVWAYTKFTGDTSATSTTLKYGNGGFLYPAAAGGECFVDAPEFGIATADRWAARSATGELNVFFTRPCHACEVWIRYDITPKGGAGGSPQRIVGDFPIRRYSTQPSHAYRLDSVPRPHEILQFAVRTCGTTWALTGTPLAAVQRRSHFSVSIMRADGNFLPSFEAGSVPAQVLELSAGRVLKGNGGGGHLVSTGPLNAISPPTLSVTGGFGTMRLMYTRACYECGMTFGGREYRLAVLTPVTQVIANPVDPSRLTQLMNTTAPTEFYFEVYAADEMGDRSFSTGGPTYIGWNARYQQQTVSTETLSISVPVTQPFSPTDVEGRTVTLLPSAATVGTLSIAEGTAVQDGIPVGAQPGLVKLALNEPVTDLPVNLKVGGGGTDIPTRTWGSRSPPRITYTVVADRFFVKNYDVLQTQAVVVGDSLSVSLAAAGVRPGDNPEELKYYLAKKTPGAEFSAYADCASAPAPQCTSCEITLSGVVGQNVSIRSDTGEAVFHITIQKAIIPSGSTAVNCNVKFGSSLQRGVLYALPFAISVREPGAWAWVSTENFAVSGSPTVASVTGAASRGAVKTLSLQLFDNDFSPKSGFVEGTPLAASAIGITMNPPDCFSVTALPYVSIFNNIITWSGKFNTEGSCEFTGVSGLGPGVIVSQTLGITVKRTVRAQIVGTDIVGNFTGSVVARTTEGALSAMTGVAVGLEFVFLDGTGALNAGDYNSLIILEGSNGQDTLKQTATASQGRIALQWVPSLSTRRAGSNLHSPWYFEAFSDLQNKPFSNIGPLYVVTRATVLRIWLQKWGQDTWVELPTTYRDCSVLSAAQCRDGITPPQGAEVPYVNGYPFRLKFALTDRYGNSPQAAEDIGYNAHLGFNPLTVPCRTADYELYKDKQRLLLKNCQLQGSCTEALLFPCGVDQWQVTPSSLRIPMASTPEKTEGVLGAAGGEPVRFMGPYSTLGRFVVTSSGVDYTVPSEESAWLSGIRFALPYTLALQGGGCVPQGQPVFTSVTCTLGDVQSIAAASASSSIRRVAPVTPVAIKIRVVDKSFDTVAGDDHSTLSVPFSVGTLTGFDNNQFKSVIVQKRVSQGIAVFENLGFPVACASARLRARVLPTDANIDGLNFTQATMIPMLSELFEVAEPVSTGPQPPPTPLPTSPGVRLYPTAVLKLGKLDMATFDPAAFEAGLLQDLRNAGASTASAVVLEVLCNIPASRASRIPPITDLDKANGKVCKKYAESVSAVLRDAAVQQDNLASGDACPCVPLAEFRIEAPDPGQGDTQQAIVSALQAVPTLANSTTTATFGLSADSVTIIATGATPLPSTPGPTPRPETPLPTFDTLSPNTSTSAPPTLSPIRLQAPSASPHPLILLCSAVAVLLAFV